MNLSETYRKYKKGTILESFTKKTSSKKTKDIVDDSNNFFDAFNVVAEYILDNHYYTSPYTDKKFGKMTRYICSLKENIPLFKRNLEFEYFNGSLDVDYVKLNASGIYQLHLIRKDNVNLKILCLFIEDDNSVKEKGLNQEYIGYSCPLDFKKDLTPLQRTRIAVALSSQNLKESFVGKTYRKKSSDIARKSEEPFDIFKIVGDYIFANYSENFYFDDECKEGEFDCYIKDWENCIIRKNLRFEFMDKIGHFVSLDGIGPYKLRLIVSDGEYKSIRCFFSPLESDARKKHIDTDQLYENDDTDFMEDLSNEERMKIAKFLGCFSELQESFTKNCKKETITSHG